MRYPIRARDLPGMRGLVGRVRKIAQGAALMTETKVETRSFRRLQCHGKRRWSGDARDPGGLGPPISTRRTRNWRRTPGDLAAEDIDPSTARSGCRCGGPALADFVVPLEAKRAPLVGSTDVGDVSRVVPTGRCVAPTSRSAPPSTPGK